MCLVHSTVCRTGFTHAGKILLQLLQCLSGQMAVPLVGWGMPIFVVKVGNLLVSKFDMQRAHQKYRLRPSCQVCGIKEKVLLLSDCFFIVFFIVIWTCDIWSMIDWVGTVQEIRSQLWSCLAIEESIRSSDVLATRLGVYVARAQIQPWMN